MGKCHASATCFGCGHGMSRRRFLKLSGAAAAATALGPIVGRTEEAAPKKPHVALVFLANSRGREIWPYPGYDCEARQRQVTKFLSEGCSQVEFTPVVVQNPNDITKALALKDSVDGYLVNIVTLSGYGNVIGPIAKLGKPLLLANDYLGGTVAFLTGYASLSRQGVPVAGVSSTRAEDLVEVARHFGDITKPGATPETFARQCQETYRRTFGRWSEQQCHEDKLTLTEIGECVKRLKESRFLIVGAGGAKPGETRDYLGAKGIFVGFDELRALYDKVDRDEATEWGRRWSTQADKVLEAAPEWITKAGAVYLAMLALMKKYDTDSITMNCLGGFASGQLPAYPCLGFMQILNDGGQGVCEAQPDDSVSTLMGRILGGRAGYVSDPDIDTSKNHVMYSHCMALTKVFGPKGPASKYRIRTLHNRDPRGCCAQSFLPEGYLTTTFRTNVGRKKMVIHQARAAGNLDSERGCRTQLLGEVRGDIEKLFHQWDQFGWHRVTVYGDLQDPLIEFGKALGLEVIREA